MTRMNESRGAVDVFASDTVNYLYDALKDDLMRGGDDRVYEYYGDDYLFPQWLYRVRVEFVKDGKFNAATVLTNRGDMGVVRSDTYALNDRRENRVTIYNERTRKLDAYIRIDMDYFQNHNGSMIRSTIAHELRHCHDIYIRAKLGKPVDLNYTQQYQSKLSHSDVFGISDKRGLVKYHDEVIPYMYDGEPKLKYDADTAQEIVKYLNVSEIQAYYQGDMMRMHNLNTGQDSRMEYAPKLFMALHTVLSDLLIMGDRTKTLRGLKIQPKRKYKTMDNPEHSDIKMGFIFKHTDLLDRIMKRHPSDENMDYAGISKTYTNALVRQIMKRYGPYVKRLTERFRELYSGKSRRETTDVFAALEDIEAMRAALVTG